MQKKITGLGQSVGDRDENEKRGVEMKTKKQWRRIPDPDPGSLIRIRDRIFEKCLCKRSIEAEPGIDNEIQ